MLGSGIACWKIMMASEGPQGTNLGEIEKKRNKYETRQKVLRTKAARIITRHKMYLIEFSIPHVSQFKLTFPSPLDLLADIRL